jgi:hypothetical protein
MPHTAMRHIFSLVLSLECTAVLAMGQYPKVAVLNRSEQCHTSLSINVTEWIRAVPELIGKVGQLLGECTGGQQ